MDNLSSGKIIVQIVLILGIVGQVKSNYTSIFSFGDSIADTGNLYATSYDPNAAKNYHFFLDPYGETFFHHPTGRCSDGRVIIDFLAEAFGLPYLSPYLAVKNKSLEHFQSGVNFAVVGATALDISFFEERGIHNEVTNNSLGNQVDWFKELLPSLCKNYTECSEFLKGSLLVVGEIGGNDYNYPFFMKRSIEEVETYVPLVINTISSAIKELIRLGATNFMVPGNFPIGCIAAYLTIYESSNQEDYDPAGCLIWLNKFSELHNEELIKELGRIEEHNPHTKIAYADYYDSTMRFFRSPERYGFRKKAHAACCGGGGPYNYNSSTQCGYSSASVCDDPSRYVNWDGLHLTESAYEKIAKTLLEKPTLPQEFALHAQEK